MVKKRPNPPIFCHCQTSLPKCRVLMAARGERCCQDCDHDLRPVVDLEFLPQEEGCTDCGWRGSMKALMVESGYHDKCPDCAKTGTMTTYYTYEGQELREGDFAGY